MSEAVDRVMADDVRNAFCAVRPPGHHAGPRGIVTCPKDPDGSHGFCLLNNVIVSPFARSVSSHARALVDGGNSREDYDAEEMEWESEFEARMIEEKERKRQAKLDMHMQGLRGQQNPPQAAQRGDLRHGDNDLSPAKRPRKDVDYHKLLEESESGGRSAAG